MAPEPVWVLWSREKCLVFVGNRFPVVKKNLIELFLFLLLESDITFLQNRCADNKNTSDAKDKR
jgi:hypothetical protein